MKKATTVSPLYTGTYWIEKTEAGTYRWCTFYKASGRLHKSVRAYRSAYRARMAAESFGLVEVKNGQVY